MRPVSCVIPDHPPLTSRERVFLGMAELAFLGCLF